MHTATRLRRVVCLISSLSSIGNWTSGSSADLDVLGVICIDSHLFHALELRRRTLQSLTLSRAAQNACAAPPCSSPAAASAGLCLPILTCVTLVLSNEIITFASVTGLLYKRRMMKVNLFIVNGL